MMFWVFAILGPAINSRQTKTCGRNLTSAAGFRVTGLNYGFGEADGDADAAGEAEDASSSFAAFLSARFALRASSSAFSFSVSGPSFTDFASKVPSARFQYEPRASSFSTTSFIVAGLPAFVRAVLPVILKTRDFSLP